MLTFLSKFHTVKFKLLVICSVVVFSLQIKAEVKTDDLIKEELQSLSAAVKSQSQVESADDQIQKLLEEHRQLGHEIKLQTKYRQQLTFQVEQLAKALVELDREMDSVRQTKIRLLPLLDEMYLGLEALIEQDLPFLVRERSLRLALLKEKLADPNATQAQKLNQLLDAYQVEIAYGHSVETWLGRLSPTQEVSFLRVGRIGYYYLSLDTKTAGMWQRGEGWQTLSGQQAVLLKQAISAANSNHSPALLMVPAHAATAS